MSRLLLRFFWDVYDYIGRLLLLNLLSFFLCLLVVPLPGVIAGTLYFLHRISSNREPSFGDFFSAFRKYYLRSMFLSLIYALLCVVIAVNIHFYMSPSVVSEQLRFPAALLAGIFFWVGVIVVASALFAFPALIKYDLTVLKSLRRGFVYLFANPTIAFFALVLFTIVFISTAITVVGIFFFSIVLLASVANAAFDTATERIEAMIEKREVAANPGETERPVSWHDIKRQEKKAEEKKVKEDRYSRGLKDIIRPWDMK